MTEHTQPKYCSPKCGFYGECSAEDIKVCKKDSRPHTSSACEDNGCTDPEACDEICEHSRIYSPAWVRKHDKEEREKVLKTLHHNIDCVVGDPKCANEKQCCECSLAMTHVECHHGNVLDTREEFDGCLIESLRTTKEGQ